MTDTEARDALAGALQDHETSGIHGPLSCSLACAQEVLAALDGWTLVPVDTVADAEALAALTPTKGHNVIFIDPGPRYRAVIYDPDGHWDESVWSDYPTLAAAVRAALGDEHE